MGITADLREIPAAALARVKAGGEISEQDLELARLSEKAGIEQDRYHQHHFENMKKAYSQAAENGNALVIYIA
jgi:hypothetical protein